MKTSWRDYCTILMAFTAVFLCGYGIGHLVCKRNNPPPPIEESVWEQDTLDTLREALELRDEQTAAVEEAIAKTAEAIEQSNRDVLLEYHRHVDDLYARLIEIVDDEQAVRLRKEKKTLEKQIQLLSSERP